MVQGEGLPKRGKVMKCMKVNTEREIRDLYIISIITHVHVHTVHLYWL